MHPHDPSWQNWPLLEIGILGNIVPDFPLINKSFNLILQRTGSISMATHLILQKIFKTGFVSEPAPQADLALRTREQELHAEILKVFGQAVAIRHVDAGSCNGCELEIHAINGPHYNIEGMGVKFVASPRHADMLLVTGPVSRNLEVALKRTYDATPEPKWVVAMGDCGCTGGNVRRELRLLRKGLQRHPGRRRSAGLPAHADRPVAGHPRGGQPGQEKHGLKKPPAKGARKREGFPRR